MKRLLMTGAAGLFAAVGLGACGGGGGHHSPSAASTPSSASTIQSSSGSAAPGGTNELQDDLVSVIQKVRPAVVEISTSSDLGSGVLFDTKGDVVTNNHVAGSATSFSVHLSNGTTEQGTLVGAYPPDDLAVIRISPPKGVSPATFGNSQKLQVGDIVVAIGNPLGLSSSVTEGIVSYNGRTVSEPGSVVLPSTIQTSAAINPGNSGGALVDLAGDVIGIPTLAATDQQIGGGAAPGIGFAIPSSIVKSIAGQLASTGKVTNSGRAALGVEVSDAVDQSGRPVGVAVVSVTANGPAAKAGIPPGSLITKIDGKPTPDVAALAGVLAGLQPGTDTQVTYVNPAGQTKTVPVALGQLGAS